MAYLRVFLLLSFLHFKLSTAADGITATDILKDTDSLVSSNGTFKLTFFSPPNSTNRYVGICYNKIPVMYVIWVANRNNPLTDSSGSFKISEDGNLQVLNGQKHILWSSNVTLSQGTPNQSKAQLLDTGNLVLFSSSNRVIWQSFDHPTNTLLPQTSLIYHKNTMLQAWKTPSDPSQGRFSSALTRTDLPEIYVWDNGRRYYRSGPWNGNIFLGIEATIPIYQSIGINIQTDGQGNTTLTYLNPRHLLTNYELSYDGIVERQVWDDSKGDWNVIWKVPNNDCDVYGKCGDYGSCNSHSSPICKCLKGFEPKNRQEWDNGNWTSGCTRTRQLLCGIEGAKEDAFFRLQGMKPPADTNWSRNLDQDTCRSQCLANCSCLAYAFDLGVGCMTWSETLIDTQVLSSSGVDLYIRLEHSEIGNNNKLKLIIGVTAVSGTAILVAILCYLCRRKAKQGERNDTSFNIEGNQSLDNFEELPLFKFKTLAIARSNFQKSNNFEELPLFKFKKLAIATSNFHESNKLGQGGFGLVYRGTLEDGQEVAIKRLSGTSRQGIEEFMNEVLVISKLQHRNLVKLLGCCVERHERMLIYDYMLNKSLDTFLYDPLKREILDWKKRYNIIEGICRGLLYLHRDSRLKIIHRDLKAANILLDENLNPKISDFGMARIFGGDQIQADTTRVVGTYGYMPPEYAIEGRFSEKSDVFSFGVLVLEIITAKRTRWHEESSLSLLGYVWKQWSENNVVAVIDPEIAYEGFEAEITKCIQLGLLCVQEYAQDRPDMSEVISKLSALATADFQQPTPPGFTRFMRDTSSTHAQSRQIGSDNSLSITNISGR